MTTEQLTALISLWLIKPLLLLLVVVLGALVLRKSSAALQHFWLLCGLVALVLMPLMSLVLPVLSWEVLPANSPALDQVFIWLTQWVSVLYDPVILMCVAAVYLFPATFLVFYFLLGLLQLRRQTATDIPCTDTQFNRLADELYHQLGLSRPIVIQHNACVSAPHIWGFWHPVIRLPLSAVNWTEERKLSVLLHEFAHAARGDWISLVIVRLVCALFWFLPPVWWLAARLENCAEMACDDFIYRLRDKHLTYAENLLAIAREEQQEYRTTSSSTSPHAALPMAGHSPLYLRIHAVMDEQRPRAPVALEKAQYWVLALLLLLVPLAAVQVMPVRELLQLRLINLQPATEFSAESLSANNPGNDPLTVPVIELIDSATLKTLKQQLIQTELPRQRLTQIDEVRVLAERPRLMNESADIQPQLPVPVPVIRIEGYMPLTSRMPVYPAAALQRGIEGEVLVRFDIDESGKIVSPQIIHAIPKRVFERAVLLALQESHYQPLRIDGQPVLLQGVLEKFTFQLSRDAEDP